MARSAGTIDLALRPGDRVDVFVEFAGSWAPDFEVATVDGEHCLVRRASDRAVLPAPIPLDRIRPATPSVA